MIFIKSILIKLLLKILNFQGFVGRIFGTFNCRHAFRICFNKLEMNPDFLIVLLLNYALLLQHLVLIGCNTNYQWHRRLEHI